MAIYNVHSRVLHRTGADQAWALVDTLATTNDALWPAADWPAMRLDAPLSVGAAGGHGPIRYTVIGYAPGLWVRFRFTAPRGFDGFHEFTVHDGPDGAELRHTLAITARGPARFTWPLAYRWMHDAALEDCLDRAELATTGGVQHPARSSAGRPSTHRRCTAAHPPRTSITPEQRQHRDKAAGVRGQRTDPGGDTTAAPREVLQCGEYAH